jgi:hypothetical protein
MILTEITVHDSSSDGHHDLPFKTSFSIMPEGFRNLIQLKAAIYNRFHLARYKEVAHVIQILRIWPEQKELDLLVTK